MRAARLAIHLLVGLAIGLSATAAFGLPLGVRILDPAQVLRDRTQTGRDGVLYLEDQQGTLRRFITSTSDPIIVNPGDGQFHPASFPVVEAAIEAADARFTSRIRFDVYILPYPVNDPLGSWADGEAIYLSPGVRALSDRQVEYLVSHEAGHLVHRTFLRDDDRQGWARYRHIRGIEDTTRFNEAGAHRDRPHEIFAEDFRVLFGSVRGPDAEAIENPDLPIPEQVPGLREFFLELIGVRDAAPALAALLYPNPIASGEVLRLALPGGTAPLMTIYNVQGRRVRGLAGLRPMGQGIFETSWDGKDDAGRPMARGAYYCLVRDGEQTARIPIRLAR